MSHPLRWLSRASVVCVVWAVLGALVFSVLSGVAPAPPLASAAPPWGGEVSNEPITAGELLSGAAPDGLTANARFAPPEGADKASQPFLGTLRLDGAPMTMLASDTHGQPNPDGFTSNPILGKDTTFFPDVSLSFFTHKGHLVPTTQHVVRNGELPGTRSWWNIIVQPGRVWSDPADPPGWNRAAFPFALEKSLDGMTHNGVALFLYRGSQVSPVRFQVVQQNAPWYVVDYFSAWGVTDAGYRPGGIDNLGQRMLAYEKELADKLPVKPWSALPEEVSSDPLVQTYTTQPETNPDVLVGAVVKDGVLYRTECRTAAGPYPYCDEMRYGVHSVTKTAMLNVTMLRLARKYGTRFLDEPIAEYLRAARRPGWEDVTFRDMANMASGHSATRDEYGHYVGDTAFSCFEQQRSQDDMTEKALEFARIREPGTVFNYQDQDSYLLGVALDALLKSKEGPDASVWEMLEREVYRPIGIYHAPSASTVEDDGSRGQPKMGWGYYATVDDLAKIGLLYQNHGAWDGRQILNRGIVDSLLPTTTQPPEDRSPAPRQYYLNWWFQKIDSWWVPSMNGWGGNRVALLPDGMVAVRIRNLLADWPPDVPEWPPPDPCNADAASR